MNNFKHYLRFISLGRTDLYQICEPIGFDGFRFVVEQGKLYARDVKYSIDKLRFVDAIGMAISQQQQINPQGDVLNHLDYGLQWLFAILKEHGFESKVEYIIEKDGVQFSQGLLDFTGKNFTDWISYVEATLIDKTDVADTKKQLDTKFNLFSDKNYRNETITPAPAINVLKKATPITATSKWNCPTALTVVWQGVDTDYFGIYFNAINNLTDNGINNSLSYMMDNLSVNEDFKYIKFKNRTSNIVVKLRNINFILTANVDSVGLYYRKGLSFGASIEIQLGNWIGGIPGEGSELYYGIYADFTIPQAEKDEYLWIYFRTNQLTELFVGLIFLSGTAEITSTETALDIVIKGVRYIDAIKQASKFVKDIPINAIDFEEGGKHYNRILFNKRMVSAKTDYFYTTPKELYDSVYEVNQDCEFKEDEIFIGHETAFYEDVEIGAVLELPSKEYSENYSDRFMINNLKYDYETFEQDRTSDNTGKSFHTQSEWNFQNDGVENKKEIKIKLVEDPYAIQKMSDLEIEKPTTQTTDDDKLYTLDITELAPNSFNTWGATLLMKVLNNGYLQILNQSSDFDENSISINWDVLGLGNQFEITAGQNVGIYAVVGHTSSVLTLNPITATPNYTGDAFIRVKYYYSNVLYVTRTNEGFTADSPKQLNMRYSIKRNLKEFYHQFASALLYCKKDILNLFFKNNGAFTSQLLTESEPVVENAPILYSDLPEPLVEPIEMNIDCVADFIQILAILNNYKVNRGYIRVYNNRNEVKLGYFKKLEQTWATNKLTLLLEKKYEPIELVVNFADGVLTIGNSSYELGGISQWWVTQNDYIQFFDKENTPIRKEYKYNFVILNGVKYNSIDELVGALIILVND